MYMSFIKVKNISYAYGNNKKAIDDVSFSIEKGTYTTIIGHNGSGKSTLAKLMAGLLELNTGEIIIDGEIVKQENIESIRKKLGIVFQNPDNQFIGSTVRDDVAFGLENRMVNPSDMDNIITEYIEKVGLTKYIDSEPQNLSGGQKQRVAIAGILAMKPEIIIFDEATSMLDPKGKNEIKKIMNDLSEKEKFTVISITHDVEEVIHADDCIVLNGGKLFMHDKPSKIFEKASSLRKIGLDVPFVSKVKEEFLNSNIKLKANDIQGMVDELWQLSSRH